MLSVAALSGVFAGCCGGGELEGVDIPPETSMINDGVMECVVCTSHVMITYLGSFSTRSQCLHLLSNNLYSGNKQKKMKKMMRMIIQIIMETIASPESCVMGDL